MDYLQYLKISHLTYFSFLCFKPCYKWITFNTAIGDASPVIPIIGVLNLVINGLPSIPYVTKQKDKDLMF